MGVETRNPFDDTVVVAVVVVAVAVVVAAVVAVVVDCLLLMFGMTLYLAKRYLLHK